MLDASALLVLFLDEPGAEKVEQLLHQAAEADKPLLISAASWAEIICTMQSHNAAQGISCVREFQHTMALDVAPLDRELAEAAAQIRTVYSVCQVDAFSAALAKTKKAEFVTANTDFKPLEKLIRILWLK